MRRGAPAALGALALLAACAGAPRGGPSLARDAAPVGASLGAPIDPRATAETRALFLNLRRLAGRQVMFGHQETLAYGYGWTGDPHRSDVRDASGAFPAVYGWDLGPLFSRRPESVARLRAWIAEGYGRGGVITMSWHMGNPVSGGDAWDTTAAVPRLLPGGSHHAAYRATLDTVADFFLSLRARGRDGREALVPVVFRPFHETTGGWFWWGRRHATPAEYAALWRFTVAYLRDTRGVHNLLWSYSTDVFDSPADYLDRWPGDAWVDVLGFDDYQSVRSPATRGVLARRLRDVVELADARGKVAALTETGVETVPDSTWWTGTLLPALAADSITRRVAWALVWRNANPATDRKNHFFAPYAGHASAADFRRFRDDPLVAFEDELPDLYHVPPAEPGPIDARATTETRALFVNLRRLAGRQVMFGHQDDLAYGYAWSAEPGRSDVKESAGSYPAVYGWELGDLEKGAAANLDGVDFARMRGWIVEGHRRGGVVTISWHMNNPVTNGNAWDTTGAVAAVLPGGARHAEYVRWLDRFAGFVGSLRAPGHADGRGSERGEHLVPVVFRPFHETSGGWFWWGAGHRTPDEYRRLWRFTVEYLRDVKGVHNLLWAYSTDAVDGRDAYLAQYPGDAYVDVLGFDDYGSVRSREGVDVLARRLRDVVALADARGKVAALTETGLESLPDSTWWTGTLLPALGADSLTRRAAWALVWRNATRSPAHAGHFYAPYAGQASAVDFRRFRDDPLIAFEDELPDLYRLPR